MTTDPQAIAKLLAGNLIERRDVKAVQTAKGDYMPQRSGTFLVPFDLKSLTDHVNGKQTYGHYLVKPETQTCRIFVFDLDLNKESSYHDPETNLDAQINPREVWASSTTQVKRDLALQLFALAHGLALRTHGLLHIKTLVSYSGNKGLHVIGCLGPGTAASEARTAANTVLASCQCFEPTRGNNFWKHQTGYPSIEIEVFPKQDSVQADGFGNLVRLPMGINRKSNKESFFLRQDCEFGKFIIDDPVEALEKGSIR